MEDKERSRALDLALGQIEKQFGKGSILRLGSKDAIVPVSVISTGSISLDSALGVGGFPRGRICEIFFQLLSVLAIPRCTRRSAS